MAGARRRGIALFLCCVLSVVTVESRIRKGKYSFLNNFCDGKEIYNAIPWDCSGYVQCHGNEAFWIECPTNLYYSVEAKTCMWPTDLNRPCPPLKDFIETYCAKNPNARFQNPDHCAQYYDCSDASFSPGLGPFLKECPFPQLFNPVNNMCANPSEVSCYERYTPLNKCDYAQHAGQDCTIASTPGCEGMPNGPNPYPNRILTEYYVICRNNQTIATETCNKGDVFDPILSKCTKEVDKLSIEIYCASHLREKHENPNNCARFFDCSPRAYHPQLGRHQGECPYPQLYSTQTQKCENFEQVQCGARYEPRAPCEYAGTIGDMTIEQCMSTYYSCIGLPDGANPITGQAIMTQYIMCQGDRTLDVKGCPNGRSYDPVKRICTEATPQDKIALECMQNPSSLIADPDNCARYFNCSQRVTYQGFQPYQAECDYPLLFNAQTMQCDDFTVVSCGNRMEPKAPCDYLSTTAKCEGPLCALPCLERSPSCVGLPDGNNTYPTRDLSPFYMTCLRDRTVSVGICRFGVYDPTLKSCTTELSPASIIAYCQNNPLGIIPHYTNCARYYNCSSTAIVGGEPSYQQECLYPQLFSLDSMTCEPYAGIVCSFRFEPKGPCEYMQNVICPVDQPDCLPCEQRIPSCAGLENGNNSFVGRDSFYIVCQDERTLYVRECINGVFDPLTRSCKPMAPGPDFDITRPSKFCTTYPDAIIHSPLACSQYFDCASKVTMLGNYKKECPYPQLFDAKLKRCLPYDVVDCGRRFEPVEPCEYESNLRCPDIGTCLPCKDRFESCKNSLNGNHSIAGRPSEYKVCRDGRTLAVISCEKGAIYDPELGSCKMTFDYTNPRPYCAIYPNALLPHPENCAQFFDCRQRNTALGNYLRECPYLQLYSTEDKRCHNFDRVTCGTRFEPKAPCDYLQNTQCFDPLGCEPCNMTKPSCVGLPDGNNTFPGRAGDYIICSFERTVGIESCESGMYDEKTRQCGLDMSNPNIFCTVRPNALMAHPTQCAQYYDCSRPTSLYGTYLHECPYPQLFDEMSNSCMDFVDVNCRTRYEPKTPCEYMTNSCEGMGADCPPCIERFASCIGLPDGNNSYVGQVMTDRYVTCLQERTIDQGNCDPGYYFDPMKRVCSRRLESASLLQYCRNNPDVITANPINCAQYFDCSAASVQEGTFLRECPYPMLFQRRTMSCQNFTDVQCERRMEPVEPCQYLQNICDPRRPGCIPCEERLPSCRSLPDGPNPYPGREVAEQYVVCQAGRTIETQNCSQGVFNPRTKQCGLIVSEEMALMYCMNNPTAIIAHFNNCAQYFDCREAVNGSFLRECRYPQLFDEIELTCKNFSDVQCRDRFEPQAPCEFFQTRCRKGDPTCTPCEERLPSCIGLPDGANAFPNRPNSEFYVKCLQNRTVAVEVCQVSLFDETTRACSNNIDPSYSYPKTNGLAKFRRYPYLLIRNNSDVGVLRGFCQDSPNVLIPDPEHCSRYYNCSDPSIIEGLNVPFKQECKYPRLFGYGATNCQLFTEVQCQGRYEPKAPCEYVENQCFNATCGPCEENYPSCVGKPDGSNNFPGRVGSEYYIVCYRDRTVAIVTCTTGYYNHKTRSCEALATDAQTGP